MSRWVLFAGFALCLLAGPLRAQGVTATDQLLEQLDRISYLQGQFQQRQLDGSDAILAESSGSFKLLRPFFFSWEISSPDKQLIVANAEYLWHYDIDLQTATRRPVVGNVEASPLQILGGDESVLREQYAVRRDSEDTFTLTPVDATKGFRQLTVTFEAGVMRRMDIVDRLGQRVVVDFEQVDAQTPLTSSDFEFTPPPGDVDLFYYDE
jgi:outer membrane lipoprotein carrier protein